MQKRPARHVHYEQPEYDFERRRNYSVYHGLLPVAGHEHALVSQYVAERVNDWPVLVMVRDPYRVRDRADNHGFRMMVDYRRQKPYSESCPERTRPVIRRRRPIDRPWYGTRNWPMDWSWCWTHRRPSMMVVYRPESRPESMWHRSRDARGKTAYYKR